MTARRASAEGKGIAAALSLALALGAPGVSLADVVAPEQKVAAQALFDEARALAGQGKFADACPKYAESYRLDPSMGTRFYQAECLERIGKLASAWVYYLEVAEAARTGGLRDREAYALSRAAAIRPRMPTLAITVSPGARAIEGIEVKRNGIALGEAQWGTAVPVDSGEQVVRAEAPGKQPWEARVRVTGEGQALTVEVPALDDAPLSGSGGSPTSAGHGYRIGGFVAGAAGVVGIGVGAAFGLLAMSRRDQSNAGFCDAQSYCDSQGLELRRDAISAATVSTVAFVVGGALVAGGAALILVAPGARDPGAGSGGRPAGVALTIGPGSVAVVGRF